MNAFSSTERLVETQHHGSESDYSDDSTRPVKSKRRSSLLGLELWHIIFHLVLLVVYTFIALFVWLAITKDSSQQHRKPVYTPAQSALKWEARTLENSLETANKYKGKPRKELDLAWNELLRPSAIRVSKDTLDRINKTSVPIADGSGYMATLDVHHQLHCLRWTRQMLHPDYYGMHEGKEKNLGQHVDHCLDSLRQYIMCNADLVLLTYDWMPNFHKPWPNFEVKHECANWDSVQQWAEDNSFDGFDENLIKHPNFHPELASPFSYDVSGNELPPEASN